MSFKLLHRFAGGLLLGSTLLLAGCNDDAPSNSSATVGGTAAIGAPLVGATVNLRCQNNVTATTTTSNTGAWSASVARASLPCAVQLTGGTIGVGGIANTQNYYSITMSSSANVTTNITPLTTLALAMGSGIAFDDTWFDGLNDASLDNLLLDAETAVDNFASALSSLGYTLPADFNPFTLAFNPVNGNTYDDLLEAFNTALSTLGISFTDLMDAIAAGGELPESPENGGDGDCTSGDNKLVFTNGPSGICDFIKDESANFESYYQFTSSTGAHGTTYVKFILSESSVSSLEIENNDYAWFCGGIGAACTGITVTTGSDYVQFTVSNTVLEPLFGTSQALTVNGLLAHSTASGGSSEGLPATPLESGQFGVRFAINGVVNGTEQNGTIRYWASPFAFEDQATNSFTAYIPSDTPSDTFTLRNLPNTPGTYDCGAAFGTALGRNIEFSFVDGDGFSTMETSGVSGFTCSLTITQGRTYSAGIFYGAMEGSFQARFYKTGQAVNLADSVFVSGNFRLGDTSTPPFIMPPFMVMSPH
jgi:hypothetical protein